MDFLSSLPTFPPPPLPYLHPLPQTTPLTPLAAFLPPFTYYIALLLLPPIPSNPIPNLTTLLRNLLALLSATLFLRLPLAHHVPSSVGLTYQLALVGLYGCARTLDHFFVSYYFWSHLPRRLHRHHAPRSATPSPPAPAGPDAPSYFSLHFLVPAQGEAVTEHVSSEDGLPTGVWDRLSWALELELSMRGAGFVWSSADVRHTTRTWRPSVRDRVHSIGVHVLPVLVGSWAVVRGVHVRFLMPMAEKGGTFRDSGHYENGDFDGLPWVMQAVLTAALGAFLLAAFSFGHSMAAIALRPLAPHPLSYFPPLYTKRIWEIMGVRDFWSYGWHRLFSRLFLVYGVWPGEWIERTLMGKAQDQPADVGKVLGAFVSSALVHSFAGYTVVPGGWRNATGEAWFFMENGIAVIVEEVVRRLVLQSRRKQGVKVSSEDKEDGLHRWYDGAVGRVWWIGILLYTGRNFARGWVQAGLIREMSFQHLVE